MIQDIYPHKLNNQYDNSAKPENADFVICITNGKVLIMTDAAEKNELAFPRVSEFEAKVIDNLRYLFSVDEERYFMMDIPTAELLGEKPLIDNSDYMEIRKVRGMGLSPKYRSYAMMTAKHLNDWYRDTRFCGRCGKEMEHSDTERAMKCPECGYTAYPRIMPAVIVGVTNGDKLLLTRYRVGYQHNALVAGFTEIGETMEETVAREVMEEVGLKVKNIRYYKSQPWGIANDILLGYYCDVDDDTEIKMDSNELKYAEWVKREDIVLQPDDFSLTNEMMMKFKENQ